MPKAKPKKLSLDKIRLDLLKFARETESIFVEAGEIGFGRPCVCFSNGRASLSYSPGIMTEGEYRMGMIDDLRDEDIDPPDGVDDAYHKGDYMAVLIHDDDSEKALRQLHRWIEHIRAKGGARLVTFRTGATGIQAVVSGTLETAIVTKPWFDALKARVQSGYECHPAIIRSQFEDEKVEAA